MTQSHPTSDATRVDLDDTVKIAPSVFAANYEDARRKFLEAAPKAKSYPCSAKGPTGEALFTDVAYIGDPDARKLLVLISSTHGPEGYCGSASQVLFLKSNLPQTLPPSTAVLVIHAVNCYGFAWDRRVTAEGVDLNRNFVDFTKPLPKDVGYRELADHFVPRDLSEKAVKRAEEAIAAFEAKHGAHARRLALANGQYTNPTGMFYGGTGPTEARLTQEAIVRDFNVAGRDKVVIIDYHTGLGPYGYGELQCEESSGLAGLKRAQRIFGPSATSPVVGTSASMPINGTQDEFWLRLMGDRHTYVCLEYGTYPSAVGVLRDDHWLFAYRRDEADAELGRRIRKATKDYFYPQRLDWMEMIVWRSHQVHRQAIEALRH
ncbi:M14 family metallopeptidase [Bradyrhizobium diazoefficiens]|uniref:M14 family metallopeptidase n=1 Tax=Bradyrhizobium diazoefficiens TaxID=1355477 RepID=UPI00190BE68E|nr:M14 family metallopeptidase [Bradyrhizobium diazoefficiens]QQO13890.1 M14 family metallopeptidase [Bradyrhizobium diazoefficiens]